MDLSFSEAKGMFGIAIDLMKKGSQLEAQAKILSLQEQYLALHSENLELKQELSKVNGVLQEQTQMIFDSPFFYIDDDQGNRDGPYCPKCWQDQHKKCRVIPTPESYSGTDQCQVCDTRFGKRRRRPKIQYNNNGII